MPPTTTLLTTAADIKNARQAFENHVTLAIYMAEFAAIGQAFNLMSMIGKAEYVYVKCEDDGKVVGMAYGYRMPDGTTFYIQDIISARGSRSGSAMVAWFASAANVGMPALNKLQLSAARADLQVIYAGPNYGFTLDQPGGQKMSKAIP
jgi:hypothetical protein